LIIGLLRKEYLAIASDTPVPIVGGWKLAHQLTTKDYVYSWDGYPVLIKTIQQYTPKEMFDVQLKDGIYVQVDNHTTFPAFTMQNRQRESRHKGKYKRHYIQKYYSPTQLLEKGLTDKRGWNIFSIENAKPLQYPTEDHPVPPFIAGLWAAKWGKKVTFNFDPDWIDYAQKKIRAHGWFTERKGNSLTFKQSINTTFLTRYQTVPTKIPIEYTFGSIDQRIEFLRGIVAMKPGCYNPQLDRFLIFSRNIRFLTVLQGICESLGMKTQVFNNSSSLTHQLTFATSILLHIHQKPVKRTKGDKRRMITQVEKTTPRPVVHIETDVPFVVGQGFLPIWH
jgi:hypothetical protein